MCYAEFCYTYPLVSVTSAWLYIHSVAWQCYIRSWKLFKTGMTWSSWLHALVNRLLEQEPEFTEIIGYEHTQPNEISWVRILRVQGTQPESTRVAQRICQEQLQELGWFPAARRSWMALLHLVRLIDLQFFAGSRDGKTAKQVRRPHH